MLLIPTVSRKPWLSNMQVWKGTHNILFNYLRYLKTDWNSALDAKCSFHLSLHLFKTCFSPINIYYNTCRITCRYLCIVIIKPLWPKWRLKWHDDFLQHSPILNFIKVFPAVLELFYVQGDWMNVIGALQAGEHT